MHSLYNLAYFALSTKESRVARSLGVYPSKVTFDEGLLSRIIKIRQIPEVNAARVLLPISDSKEYALGVIQYPGETFRWMNLIIDDIVRIYWDENMVSPSTMCYYN